MNLEQIVLLLKCVVGFVSSLFAIRKLYHWIVKWQSEIRERHEKEIIKYAMITKIYAELTPNGGKSVKDTLNKIQLDMNSLKFWRRSLNELDVRPIFISDPDGHTIWANRSYLTLVKRQLSEVTGNQWLNTIHPNYRSQVRAEWKSAIEECRNFEMTYSYLVGNSEVKVRCAAIYDEGHGHFGVITRLEPEGSGALLTKVP